MKRLAIVAALTATLFSSNALGWNARGHMMVAAVAWDHLDEETRARAVALLRLNPEFTNWVKGVDEDEQGKIAFVKASVWADFIKSAPDYVNDGEDPTKAPQPNQNIGYDDKFQHRYWHFVDFPFSRDGTALVQPAKPNALTQIEKFRDTLASEADDDVKSYDMVWLLHLVGDVHQPLHATSRFSAASPEGDRGGNDVKLCERPCRNNLHSFWDGAAGSSSSPTAAIKAAGNLDESSGTAAFRTNVATWIEESFELAKRSVYRSPIGPGNGPFETTDTYKAKSRTIAEQQIALAGARLGNLLNDFLR
jgi:hypothetical protein